MKASKGFYIVALAAGVAAAAAGLGGTAYGSVPDWLLVALVASLIGRDMELEERSWGVTR